MDLLQGSSGAGHGRRRALYHRRRDLQGQAIERALRRADRMGRDLCIARRRRQIVVAEQNLDDPDVGSVLQQMRREAMAQRMQSNALGQPRRLDRRPAGGVQHGWINRMIVIAARERIGRWPGQPPVGAQDAEQLRRQHHVAVLAALAVPHQDDATRAVDVLDSKPRDLRGPQPRRIGCRQRRAALQARHGFEKSHDLVGAEHDRQLARLPRIGDALGNVCLAERDAVEETQGADDLVQPRPRNARRDEMDLEGVDLVQRPVYPASGRNTG